jgi:DNA repair protein RadC
LGLAGAGYIIAMRYQRAESPLKLDGLDAARCFFASCFADTDPMRESLWVAHLDRDAHCLHVSHHDGGPSGAQFPIRSIIADAALRGSAGVVLAHNHPSGDASPSESDRRATRRLAEAAQAIDLTIVDHIIFAGTECRSFRRMGLL